VLILSEFGLSDEEKSWPFCFSNSIFREGFFEKSSYEKLARTVSGDHAQISMRILER